MIVEKVQEALETAKQEKNSNAPLLQMLVAQFNIADHNRKSGEGVTDDKATVIINRMIEGIKRDSELSGTASDITEKKIRMLESFL